MALGIYKKSWLWIRHWFPNSEDALGKSLFKSITERSDKWDFNVNDGLTNLNYLRMSNRDTNLSFNMDVERWCMSIDTPISERITSYWTVKLNRHFINALRPEVAGDRRTFLRHLLDGRASHRVDFRYSGPLGIEARMWLVKNTTGYFYIKENRGSLTVWFENPVQASHFKLVYV